MDERSDNGEKEQNQKSAVDLSALQDFDFSGNWSESSKTSDSARDNREGGSRHSGRDRKDRRPRHQAGERAQEDRPRRDKPDRRPKTPGGSSGDRPRGRFGDERGPRRREEGEGRAHGRSRPHGRQRQMPREQIFDIMIYPEEPVVVKLTRAMRHSMRTFELFEIARLVLEKPDRFHFTLRHKVGGAKEAQPAEAPLLYQSVPDQLPFLTEESAVEHVLRNHLANFFRTEEVEVEAPKGNFQFISRCTLTGDLLGPPNYHRYQSYLANYHQKRFPHMSFERFRSNVETVKDEEALAEWMKSMTREIRYHPLDGAGDSAPVLHSLDQARHYLLEKSKDQVVRSSKNLRLAGSLIESITDKGIKPYVLDYVEGQRRFPLETSNNLRGRLRRQNFHIYKRGSHGISYVCAVKRKFREPGQRFSDSVQNLIQFLENNEAIHASELPEKFLGVKLPKLDASQLQENQPTEGGKKETKVSAAPPEDGVSPDVSSDSEEKEKGEPIADAETTAPSDVPVKSAEPSPVKSDAPAEPVGEHSNSDSIKETVESAAETESPQAESPEQPAETEQKPSGLGLNPEDELKLKRMTMDLRWLLSEGYVTEFSDGRLQVHPEVAPAGRPDPVAEGGVSDTGAKDSPQSAAEKPESAETAGANSPASQSEPSFAADESKQEATAQETAQEQRPEKPVTDPGEAAVPVPETVLEKPPLSEQEAQDEIKKPE